MCFGFQLVCPRPDSRLGGTVHVNDSAGDDTPKLAGKRDGECLTPNHKNLKLA